MALKYWYKFTINFLSNSVGSGNLTGAKSIPVPALSQAVLKHEPLNECCSSVAAGQTYAPEKNYNNTTQLLNAAE